MTSERSDVRLWVRSLVPLAAFCAVALFSDVPPLIAAICFPMVLFHVYRDVRRRSTLRQREDGVYVWVEWHGGEGRSLTDPTEDWDSEGDGDGDGGD